MKSKPIRTCVGCRNQFNKDDMIRVVRTFEGVQLDFSGKLNGRGAYLCKNKSCLLKAIKSKRLESALKVEISPEVTAHLEKEIGNE